MQLTLEAAVADGDGKEFWASLGKAALQGQTWRMEYDPWDGYVKGMDDEGAEIVLQNLSRRDLQLQMYIGRSFLKEEHWEQLAIGIPFIIEFKLEDDKPYIELRFF
jgi:hypothetical protein